MSTVWGEVLNRASIPMCPYSPLKKARPLLIVYKLSWDQWQVGHILRKWIGYYCVSLSHAVTWVLPLFHLHCILFLLEKQRNTCIEKYLLVSHLTWEQTVSKTFIPCGGLNPGLSSLFLSNLLIQSGGQLFRWPSLPSVGSLSPCSGCPPAHCLCSKATMGLSGIPLVSSKG